MKRKVAALRLSPNEEARLIREEHERRRKLRIQQVREQQRYIALQIRREVEKRRQRELEQLEVELRNDWERRQREKLNTLQKLYEQSLQLLGQGHRSAKENEPDLAAIAQREEENHIKAEERYREALKELKSQRLKDHERQSRPINARKKALQTEKERSAKVASLPPPPPNPIQNIDSKKPHIVKKSDVSAFAATHYHMPESTVDREVDPQQPNAHDGAELEVRRLQDLQREEKRRREEQLEKARLRGKEALRREHLAQDRERLLVELEHMQQTDLLRRRQQVSQMPPQIFQPLYKRQEMREDFQREMEFAFEDMYTGERRVKGDLVVQLVPEPLPALSTGSQDQELDVTLDEVVPSGTENAQRDAEQEAGSTEQETSAQVEPPRPAPRRALKKLLDRIRSQRSQWTERGGRVPAADSPTAITDQIPERDSTIDTGSLTSEEKDRRSSTEPSEAPRSSPALEAAERSAATDSPHPDLLANRIQEFTEERKKREEELEREKQQQVVLLQELEEQKAKLEQMLLEAQQEREHLKAAVTQEVQITQSEVSAHEQEVTSDPATEVGPLPGEDDHARRIREYQQRLLEQNRIHQRSVEVARQRLEEYQRALQIRHSMTATTLRPADEPPGLVRPPLHRTRPLPTPPSVPAYIRPKPQTSEEIPTRESDRLPSPPYHPGSALRVSSRLLPDEMESVSNSHRSQRPDFSAWLTDSVMERVTEHLPERVRPPLVTREPLHTTHRSTSIPLHPASDPRRALSPSITDGATLIPSHAAVEPGTFPRGSLLTGDDTERQRREQQEVQRREQEQSEAVLLQQRRQEEERLRLELQELRRQMLEQRQQGEERQRRELQELRRCMLEQRQQGEERQRWELRQRQELEQRQQEEERQRQELERRQQDEDRQRWELEQRQQEEERQRQELEQRQQEEERLRWELQEVQRRELEQRQQEEERLRQELERRQQDEDRQRWELEQRQQEEDRQRQELQQRQQEEERLRLELQELRRQMLEQRQQGEERQELEQRQQEEDRQRRELQEFQRRMLEQRQQEEARQRQELLEVQRRMLEQREAVRLQQRQQEEERQRRETEMEQMRRQKETLQALIHTDAQPAREAASEERSPENVRQTRLKLLASLLRAIEETNGGTLSHLEDPQDKDDSSSNSDPVSQSDVPAGPSPASVLPSGLLPPSRAAKPPVTRVRQGVMEVTEQHELSAIQEVETPVNSSQITGPEDSVKVPSFVDLDLHEESESSLASDRTPSSSGSDQRRAQRPAGSGTSSVRSSHLVWRERLLMGAGTSPESSESDSVLTINSPLSSDSGRGADYSGPPITSYRSPTESAHGPPDSDCLSTTTISTGSYITTDPEQNLNTDKSSPLRCEEQEGGSDSLDVSSPSGRSFGTEESSAAGRPGPAVETLFNDSSIQRIIDRYTRELNVSLSTTGKTTDTDGSYVEEQGSSVSQQSLDRVSESRREENENSAVGQTLLSDAEGAQTSGGERDDTVSPLLEHFSEEDQSLAEGQEQDSFRPLIGQPADQSSCLPGDHRDSAMERLVGQPSAHSSMIVQPPGPPVSVSLDQGGWDSTLSRMIGRLSHQSGSHWLSGGQDFYAGQLMGQVLSEQSTTWLDEGAEESRMRPLVGELDESAGHLSGSSGETTRVDLGVSTEASVPSYPTFPPEASSHSASVPGDSPHPQDQTSPVDPERTEVFPGSDSFHPLLAEVTHNDTADPSMTFHLPEHDVPDSPEGQPSSRPPSEESETRDDPSVESELSPERLRTEEPSGCATASPASHESFSQLVTSQCHPHESVLAVSPASKTDVELTALDLSNLSLCDDTQPVNMPQPEEPFCDVKSEQVSDQRNVVSVSEKILDAAREKGILEQSEITLVSLTDSTLQDQETTIADEEGTWEDKCREEGQEDQEAEASTLLPDETPEDKHQTHPATLLEFQWGPDTGLQEVHQQRRRALIQRSSHRVEEIKARRALAREQAKAKDSHPVTCKTKRKAETRQTTNATSKGGAAEPQRSEKSASIRQKRPQPPPAVSDSRQKKVAEIKICTTEQRKLDVSEMHHRTQRLYEQLEEVKHQKAIRSRQEAYAQNRLKAKEFHMKTLQKLRAKQTLQ